MLDGPGGTRQVRHEPNGGRQVISGNGKVSSVSKRSSESEGINERF